MNGSMRSFSQLTAFNLRRDMRRAIGREGADSETACGLPPSLSDLGNGGRGATSGLNKARKSGPSRWANLWDYGCQTDKTHS